MNIRGVRELAAASKAQASLRTPEVASRINSGFSFCVIRVFRGLAFGWILP
jgi:hypothetical protein